MLYNDITDRLPEGLSRPLYAQWVEGGKQTGWVRAGDLRRQGEDLVMVPRWDGEAFALLWAAAQGDREYEDRAQVTFAVADQGALLPVARVAVGFDLRNRVRSAIPRKTR